MGDNLRHAFMIAYNILCSLLYNMICHTKLDYDNGLILLGNELAYKALHHHSKEEYSCEHTTEVEH